jgi:2,4-dienoyl-CoA reductase-like NADH-dependent reductase (Old Yellow Enzyme family)
MVFQAYHLLPELTALENVLAPLLIRHGVMEWLRTSAAAHEQARLLLDRFGLAYLHVVDGLAFGFHGLGEPLTLGEFRQVFHGPLMGNCGYDQAGAEAAVAGGMADLVAFGRPFISNPDLVDRFRHGWPLAAPADMATWYSPTGARGYTDFPPHA